MYVLADEWIKLKLEEKKMNKKKVIVYLVFLQTTMPAYC